MFGSTYLCECSFSVMKQIKTGYRPSIKDINFEIVLRISLKNIQLILINYVITKRQSQLFQMKNTEKKLKTYKKNIKHYKTYKKNVW